MTLLQQERELETLNQEADAIAVFIASLDMSRLILIANLVNEELVLRYEGKPAGQDLLH